MLTLRPYQSRGLGEIKLALRALPDRRKSVLYVLPTGGGKTVMFADMARGAAEKKNRVLILTHRREILVQTLRALHALGVTCGQIVAGGKMTQDAIQVGMVQTVVKRLPTMRRPDLIIPDEAHHCLEDNSYGAILSYWREAVVVGFTATPERLDGRGLGESFETMVQGPNIRELVRDGFLAPPILYAPPSDLLGIKYHLKRGDFDTGEQERAMDTTTTRGRKIVGDVIEHYRQYLDRLPVVCFCVSIRHSEIMAEEFRRAGYVAAHVWGNMPRVDRDKAIHGLADGSVHVVTSCDVISEGVDVPVMAGAILLRRTMSLALYLQQAGRALRLCEGKSAAVILDHAGNYQLHGHVLADREWSLEAKARGERGEEPPTTTTCPECYGVWPGRPRTCPACGYDFGEVREGDGGDSREVKVIAGELQKIGVEGADDLAGLYAGAMKMDPKARAAMLARKGLALLESTKRKDERPTAEAWRARGGRV